jgi:hypothetical protein
VTAGAHRCGGALVLPGSDTRNLDWLDLEIVERGRSYFLHTSESWLKS